MLRPHIDCLEKLAAGVRFAVGEQAKFRKSPGNPPELKRRMVVQAEGVGGDILHNA